MADYLVDVLLGPKWSDTVQIFRLLAPTLIATGLINPLSWLLFSLGMVDRSLKIGLVLAPWVIASYLLGLAGGPNGVAVAYSLAMLAWIVPHVIWATRDTPVRPAELLRVLIHPLVAGVLAVGSGILIRGWLERRVGPSARLLTTSVVLGLTYAVVLLYGFGQKAFFVDLLKELGPRKRTATPPSAVTSLR
jgi:PST family polysaccharide transporter